MQLLSRKLITKDNITINVGVVAVIQAVDPLKVICNVEDCCVAVSEAAQTNLRDQLSRAGFQKFSKTEKRLERACSNLCAP